MSLFPKHEKPGPRLRELLAANEILRVPGCYDALSARMVERAGFSATFISGFSVAAARLGLPDVGLMSYGEMLDQARNICASTSIPVLGDADTGYGNPVNAERTMIGCARSGLACVMFEDQRWPKRCGHTAGKEIVDRDEALARVRASVRARDEHAPETLIMARTDAAAVEGFDEALWRAEAFAGLGADITFLEAPESTEQMEEYCRRVPGFKMANLVEDGRTPWLESSELQSIGYSLVAYPVSMLLGSIQAMEAALCRLDGSEAPRKERATFDEAREIVGWGDYDERLARLAKTSGSDNEES